MRGKSKSMSDTISLLIRVDAAKGSRVLGGVGLAPREKHSEDVASPSEASFVKAISSSRSSSVYSRRSMFVVVVVGLAPSISMSSKVYSGASSAKDVFESVGLSCVEDVLFLVSTSVSVVDILVVSVFVVVVFLLVSVLKFVFVGSLFVFVFALVLVFPFFSFGSVSFSNFAPSIIVPASSNVISSWLSFSSAAIFIEFSFLTCTACRK